MPDKSAFDSLLRDAKRRLEAAGIESAENDAWRLAMWASDLDMTQLVVQADTVFHSAQVVERFHNAVARRAQREPLQWIEGEAAFLDFEVRVGPGVLVPRPETEVTALCAIEQALDARRILDCGTGSGVLAIALARRFPSVQVHATERSQAALVWAARNIESLAPQIQLHQGWFFSAAGDFDLIVSNPPYVSAREWDSLEPEVKIHDPKVALVPAGLAASEPEDEAQGFGAIEQVLAIGFERLNNAGSLVCEIGASQGPRAREIAQRVGFDGIDVQPDLTGRDRVLVATKSVRSRT